MSGNDPFAGLGAERTIIKPRLGKADDLLGAFSRHSNHAEWSSEEVAINFSAALEQLNLSERFVENPLLSEAVPLLRMASAISVQSRLQGLKALSMCWVDGLNQLEKDLQKCKRSAADRVACRYILCTLLDEFAANTPWGGSGSWAPHSLLLHFFGETWGGEKVFALTQKLMKSPQEHCDILELVFIALSLGFKGKYHVQADGAIALGQLRNQLHTLIESTRSSGSPSLNPTCWTSKAPAPKRSMQWVPIGLPLSAVGALLAVVFTAAHVNINTKSDAVFDQITQLQAPPTLFKVPTIPLSEPSHGLELPIQLQTEITSGLLMLRQVGNVSTVILTGDNLFASGKAELNPSAIPLVQKVATELARHPGQITITGYTDNQAIRSLQYPSNWQLSSARALHVAELMAPLMPNFSMGSEGAGAANPLAPNTTPEGRARNRRVEIKLVHQT